MFTLLVGALVVTAAALLGAVGVGGLLVAKERKKTEAATDMAERLAADADRYKAEAAAAEKRAHELARDNKRYGEQNRGLADELAGERAQVGHLTEVGTGLHHAIKARDELLGNMVEALDESRTLLARLHGLAEQAKGLIHSRRGT